MQTLFSAKITIPGLMFLLTIGSDLHGQDIDEQPREQIGEVFGKPVYRDEIRVSENVSPSAELHRLFTAQVAQHYRQKHQSEVAPSLVEIRAASRHFDDLHRQRIREYEPALRAQLKSIEKQLAAKGLAAEEREELVVEKMTIQARLDPPGESFAAWMLKNWKFQRHLHEKYGGGRILFQQAGLEAFDATRKWLEAMERDGQFKIHDPGLRSTFYDYWTTQNHGAFLTDDKERIRDFLDPEWAKQIGSQH